VRGGSGAPQRHRRRFHCIPDGYIGLREISGGRRCNVREFIAGLGSAAAAWPIAANAKQTGRLSTIGVLGSGAGEIEHQ
jgi:hypothetical protein